MVTNLNYINLKLIKNFGISSWLTIFATSFIVSVLFKNIASSIIILAISAVNVLNTRLLEKDDLRIVLSLPVSSMQYNMNILQNDLLSISFSLVFSIIVSYILKVFLSSIEVSLDLIIIGLIMYALFLIIRNILKWVLSIKSFRVSYGGWSGLFLGLSLGILNTYNINPLSFNTAIIILFVLSCIYLLTFIIRPELKE